MIADREKSINLMLQTHLDAIEKHLIEPPKKRGRPRKKQRVSKLALSLKSEIIVDKLDPSINPYEYQFINFIK